MPQIDNTRAARPASQSRILSALLMAERVTRWTMRRVAIAVKGMCSARDICWGPLRGGVMAENNYGRLSDAQSPIGM